MRLKQHNNISEIQVEDALTTNLSYLQRILQLPNELKLISRQMRLKDGEQRLDLLVSSGKDICLVELKVSKYSGKYVDQIISYANELKNLQWQNKLLEGPLKLFLLVTQATKEQIRSAKAKDISLIIYEPIEVLKNYYQNLTLLAPFLRIKPNDYGVFSLGLINRTLLKLYEREKSQKEIAIKLGLSIGSVHNHLRIAKEFGLVRERNKNYFLTDIGDKYIAQTPEGVLVDRLSQEQISILKQFIAKDPFYSSSVFGIYSIVESSFLLSRNIYPIKLTDLQQMFKTVAGKSYEWRATRSISTATYTFLNFAIDLELLGKIGKKIVITPSGFKFILMLQLHKSIEMIESLTIRG